jgi:hypothetical protein
MNTDTVKYKMPVRRSGTFGTPPEPAYQVLVMVKGTDTRWEGGKRIVTPTVTTLTLSARDEREAARIAGEYSSDHPVMIVPRGTPAESLDWTQPGK